MTTVAQDLQAWLANEQSGWTLPTDVVVWARLFGEDLEKAWNECPRADWLMALAGTYYAPHQPVVHAVCSVAEELMALETAPELLTRKAVARARQLSVADDFEGGKPEASARLVVRVAKLSARAATLEEERRTVIEKVWNPAAAAITDVVRRELTSTAKELAAYAEAHGEVETYLAARAPVVADRAIGRVKVRRYAANVVTFYGQIRRMHTRAVAALTLSVTGSMLISRNITSIFKKVPKALRKVDEAAIAQGVPSEEQIVALVEGSRSRVFSEAAVVFEAGTQAFAALEREGDAAFRAAIEAMVTFVTRSATPSPPAPADPQAPQRAFLVAGERRAEQKHREYADRVRELLPLTMLGDGDLLDEDEIDPQENPRGALLQKLEEGMQTLALVSGSPPVDAFEMAKAMLTANVPLDSQRLAEVLATYLERLVAMCEEQAAVEKGEVRETILAVEKKARESMVEFQRISKGRTKDLN